MTDSWLSYHCCVREADVAKVEKCLEEAGALAVSCTTGEQDRLLVDLLDGAQPLWPVCEVTGLFEPDANLERVAKLVSENAVIPLHARTTTLHDRNWHESWRDQFHPQCFGKNLWICPTWAEPPAGANIVVRIDPGMAFGTGNHATTALCLEWLAGCDGLAGAKVLDYGCGSGILGIAAAKLGAAEVTAVDIDAAALKVCEDNVRLNRSSKFLVADPTAITGRRYDIIVANILLEPLAELAQCFARHLSPGGRIALSGILCEQAADLLAAYSGKFKLQTPRQLGEWALLAGVLDGS